MNQEFELGRTVHLDDVAKVFEEWDRRWRENPQEFMDLVTHLTKDTPLSYGQACAPYFFKLLEEIQA
jgi:hypothetical protein